MANAVVYVNSAAGGSNNGTTWANAYTTLGAAVTASGTGGTDFYIKSTHSETATSQTYTFKGLPATPDRVFSTDSTNSPPQTGDLLAGATIAASAGSITLNGFCYIYGCTFNATNTNGAQILNIASATSDMWLDTCTLQSSANLAGYFIIGGIPTNANGRATLINTSFVFDNAAQYITGGGAVVRWVNNAASTAISGTIPTNLFNVQATNSRSTMWITDGVDLSALSGKTVVAATPMGGAFQFIDCRLPASITLAATPTAPGGPVIDFITTDSTVVNTSSCIQTRYAYQGTLTADTGTYNNATDGVNPMSWKVISSANCNPQSPFECFEIVQWAAAGTYAASKLVATSATAALTNNDVWVEIDYLGNSSYPLSTSATTGPANQIPQGSSAAALTTGATWGTGGKGTNYVLSTSASLPSFTTSLAGYVRFKVKIGKPSLTIYIDPAVTIA